MNRAGPPGPGSGSYTNLDSLGGTWSEGLLMLMYHAIEAPPLRYGRRHLYVDPGLLRRQVRELQASDARFISADEWLQAPTRERRVMITLDDGFRSVLVNGLPVFRELGVTSICYVVAGHLGGTNVWDGKLLQQCPLMTRAEVLEWLAGGQEIGSHTMSHPRLAQIDPDRARAEIFDSKKLLEDLTGRPVRHFCYPYGSWNDRVREIVGEAGYQTACIVDPGYNFPDTDLFTLRRLMARHRKPYAAALLGAVRGALS